MFFYKEFDFDRECDISQALNSLRVNDIGKLPKLVQTKHLEPIVNASLESNSKIGRLEEPDLKRLHELGSCTHTKLLVLLLEPTKASNSTIVWIDSFLRSATSGLFNAENTAILNCRALVPNASYMKSYTDLSPTGQYSLRAVARSIRALAPAVILICQCSIDPRVGTLIPYLTRPMSEAGKAHLFMIGGKEVKVISAFHPSVFAKVVRPSGSLADLSAVNKAALLEFCFLQAVNMAMGTEVVGPGIIKLRDVALGRT